MTLTDYRPSASLAHRCIETSSMGSQASCVEVHGDLDRLDCDAFLRALVGVVAAGKDVVVDLTDTTYIDSAGMHVLRRAQCAAEAAGRHLAVISPPGSIASRVIEIVHLSELVHVSHDNRFH